MKKLLLSLFFALVALTGLQAQTIWDGTADTSWYNETSTEFEISTAEQLAGLAELMNNGNDFSYKTVRLTADIVLNDTSDWENWENSAPKNTWTPIGKWTNLFGGTFDGQGHTVSGIYINSENGCQGLFGYNMGTIKNIGVTESYIKGNEGVSGVCGYNDYYGTISNCYNSGNVSGTGEYASVGGVCGDNDFGTISNCYNSGNINGNRYVGGVCGDNDYGTIFGCYNSGTVSGNNSNVGGVCGNNYEGTISNCYNSGTVSGNNSNVGGVCGENHGTISDCYYLQGTAKGGINGSDVSGQAEGKTAEQFASGEVCWLLNGNSDENPVWFQTLDTDDYPVLDDAHNIVYAKGKCPNSKDNTYSNHGPSQVGAHTDNDNDGRCDFCGKIMTSEPAQKDGVYQISNRAELYWFAGLVNGTLSGVEQNTAANAVLTADIIINENVLDAEGNLTESTDNLLVWSPIGLDFDVKFSGTFDGQGHTVRGIYINSENDYQGLFGRNSGTIKNVGVTESYIKCYDYVGGVCGYNDGTISNCYNAGTVSGNTNVGGVCGENYHGTISNCYNAGTVSGTGEYTRIGGVCGDSYGTISNCYNSGTVIGGGYCIGSVCGYNHGTISNCYYLEGTATGGINGSDVSGQAAAKTAEQFASGEVCWLLNGSSDSNPTWFQAINTDDCPVLDNTHGTVYAIGNCPGSIIYNNDSGSSHIGEHADNDHDFRCDYCGMVMLQEPELNDGVYQISNFAELYWFAGLINGSLDGVEQNTAANAVLTADIIINENVLDANGNLTENTENLLIWIPIGDNSSNPFSGTFDGQGHTVSGVYVNSYYSYQGLLGSNSGTIKNVGVTNSYIKGMNYIGGVCGNNSGTIINCYNSGTINGTGNEGFIGGVCGENYGTISNCYNTGIVSGDWLVGGVCGYNYYSSTISNCYNTGTVNGSNNVGGVCGSNDGTISNCYNTGSINGSNNNIGEMCGFNHGTISNCYHLEGSAGNTNDSDTSGQTEAKTAEQFASGEVCWLLNGNSDQNPVWFQTLDTDDYPVLNDTHGTVYAIGNCPNRLYSFSNHGPSQIGAHTDNDNNDLCDFCGKIIPQKPEQSDGIYQISNRAELYWFAGLVNGTLEGVEQNNSANAVLTADIVINENVLYSDGSLTENTNNLIVWSPIGYINNSFYGTFDGQGHTISGIYIYSNNTTGIFYNNCGIIKNISVTDSYIMGGSYVGGICGGNDGTISNCYNFGNVNGNEDVGGVCGFNSGTISNCYNSGIVNGNNIGGVCGNNYGTISNCYNSGNVSGTGKYSSVGGVCGENRGVTISDCYNSGTVSGTGEYSSVGGVCGYNYHRTISNCYYLQGTAEGGINGNDVSGQAEVKTAKQFASGEVCWLLNEKQSDGAWGQKIGTDPCPVLGGPAVFKDGETYYNEEGSAIVETNSEQASFVIVPENLTIKIYGNDHEATVYNLAGNIVYQGIERIIPVQNPGMYMVRIGNEVQKTVVR